MDSAEVETANTMSTEDSEGVSSGEMAEGILEGQVTCSDGPVFDAAVSVGMMKTFTNTKGNFILEHVPLGILKIEVKPPSLKLRTHEQNILVESGKRKERIFIFLAEASGTIQGIVSDESGKPLVGAELEGPFIPSKGSVTVKTDDKGHYVFEDVPRGSYYLRVKTAGHMIDGSTVEVVTGKATICDFVLSQGNLAISGTVVRKKDQTPIGCQIDLVRNGTIAARTSLMSTGDSKFLFDNLVPDTYEIRITSLGYLSRTWSGKLEKSETVSFELEELPPETFSCGGS